MSYAIALRCRKCGREYPLDPLNLCDFCFSPLEVTYDYKSMARAVNRERIANGPPSMCRYRDFLPVAGDVVELGTGFTPLIVVIAGLRKLATSGILKRNELMVAFNSGAERKPKE